MPSSPLSEDEFRLLAALSRPGAVDAVVLPAAALFTRLPSPGELAGMSVELQTGSEVSLPRLVARLTELGYRRGDLVIDLEFTILSGDGFQMFVRYNQGKRYYADVTKMIPVAMTVVLLLSVLFLGALYLDLFDPIQE